MKLVFRCDGDGRIGGGHVMRCLTLAQAARSRGWQASFVMAQGGFSGRVADAGFDVTPVPPGHRPPDAQAPAHGAWLSAPWQADAAVTSRCAADADWLIWDHYGLDARWAAAVGARRTMAFDDLDDRVLGADVVLDLTRLSGRPAHGGAVQLTGPAYAPLRPEFAAARAASLARRDGPVERVIVMPGLADAASLAPMALSGLKALPHLAAEVVMGRAAQSRAATQANLGRHRLTLEPDDLTQRMVDADLCIGASGMTNWERCVLGLPTVAVAVADNQRPGLTGLADKGAVIALTLAEAADPQTLAKAVEAAIDQRAHLSARSSALCDGLGAHRVLDALDYAFRPLVEADAERLYRWRNQPSIRAVSHDSRPLDLDTHVGWVRSAANRTDGTWTVYHEGGRPIGHANAREGDDGWLWSFYLGEPSPPGTGTRMMARFLDHLRALGVKRVTGEVRADNAASIALHRRLGFTLVEERDRILVFARAIRETEP